MVIATVDARAEEREEEAGDGDAQDSDRDPPARVFVWEGGRGRGLDVEDFGLRVVGVVAREEAQGEEVGGREEVCGRHVVRRCWRRELDIWINGRTLGLRER